MSDSQPPITAEEMVGVIQRIWNIEMAGTADAPQGASFDLTAPSTGQRFRVTVAETPGWTEGMERDLRHLTAPPPHCGGREA